MSGLVANLPDMVSPDTAVRRLLLEIGRLLQPYGFHGAEPTWTRVAPGGVASVGRTRVSRTWTDGQQVLGFGLTMNATPTAWWEYCNWRNARLGLPPVPVEAATGPDLIGTESLPGELTEPWTLGLDPARSGRQALQSDIDTIRAELPRRVHAYARRALRLLEPDSYLDELLARSDRQTPDWAAIVVLLTDHGPGPRLDDAIRQLRRCVSDHGGAAYVEDVIAYARTRVDQRPVA
ncbi:hypothetical protein APR08_001099 [Nocardia amikacinitolerans]|nr:hypothetical protein [Nocardia amikacinitolerans]